MILNHVKLECVDTFLKDLTNVVSLFFLPKTLIQNKMAFPTSKLMNIPELSLNELRKTIPKNIYQYSFLYPIYHCFK